MCCASGSASFLPATPQEPSGHRLYARGDVVLLRHIRTLLHDRGYTIAGARGLLAEGTDALEAALAARPVEAASALEEARDQLDELEAARLRLEEQHRQAERPWPGPGRRRLLARLDAASRAGALAPARAAAR
ncbi:MAG: MerR family transcriptional regulator [bacterium]